MRHNLLVLSAGRKVVLVRALARHFEVVCSDLDPGSSSACQCRRSLRQPATDDPGFGGWLTEACASGKLDAVLPTRNQDMLVLDAHRKNVGFADLVLSPLDTLKVCLDKVALATFFASIDGVNVPSTVTTESFWEVGMEYPVIAKDRYGAGSKRVWVVRNKDEARVFWSAAIVQPYIKGREYTADCFFGWDGRLVQTVVRKRDRIVDGQMDVGQVIGSSSKAVEKIAGALKFCGPVNMQFIVDKNKEAWLIDINPRFSGGIGLTIAAGADYALHLRKLVTGEEIDPLPVKMGVKAYGYREYIYG